MDFNLKSKRDACAAVSCRITDTEPFFSMLWFSDDFERQGLIKINEALRGQTKPDARYVTVDFEAAVNAAGLNRDEFNAVFASGSLMCNIYFAQGRTPPSTWDHYRERLESDTSSVGMTTPTSTF